MEEQESWQTLLLPHLTGVHRGKVGNKNERRCEGNATV